MAAILGPGGPSTATYYAVDGPGGPILGDHCGFLKLFCLGS